MRVNNFFKLIIAIAVCEIVGIGGAFFTSPAAYLLAPYFLWVSFAAYLNYSIWALN